MINTVGLLLQPYTEFKLSPKVCVDDIVQHWRYLRGHGPYFPYLELLPDEKLKVEFCPARVLYPNNLYETSPNDLLNVLTDLTAYLKKAFIRTCPAILLYAHVYRIDYAKVCYIPFDSHILLPYLQEIHQGGHYKQAFTFYAEDGHMAASALKRRKVAFYNKSAEILQDKRTTTDVADILNNLPGTFYRFECSLKTAKEIKRELEQCDIDLQQCCLKKLATQAVVYAVLNKNLTRTIQHWHVPDKWKTLDKVRIWLCKYKYDNVRSLLLDMLCACVCVRMGVENMRRIIEKHLDKRHARDFMKRFESLQLEDVNCLAVFKKKMTEEVEALQPISKHYVYGLRRKERVKDLGNRLFASVLLALIELLIAMPLW